MITFIVKPDGEDPFDVEATSRHILEWEAKDRRNSLSNLENNPTMKDLYAIAYVAAYRSGKFSGTVEDFTSKCDVTEKPAGRDRNSLVEEIENAFEHGFSTPDSLADILMEWLDRSAESGSDPTRPGR